MQRKTEICDLGASRYAWHGVSKYDYVRATFLRTSGVRGNGFGSMLAQKVLPYLKKEWV